MAVKKTTERRKMILHAPSKGIRYSGADDAIINFSANNILSVNSDGVANNNWLTIQLSVNEMVIIWFASTEELRPLYDKLKEIM